MPPNNLFFFRFHFPYGNPAQTCPSESNLKLFSDQFRKHPKNSVNQAQFGEMLKVRQNFTSNNPNCTETTNNLSLLPPPFKPRPVGITTVGRLSLIHI